VHGLIRTRIEAGEWSDGRPMPGEVDLSRELGVSIGTVRKALDLLARDRIVVRARGRGTFVQADRTWRPEVGLQIFGVDGTPLRPEITVSDWQIGLPTATEARALALVRTRGKLQNVLKVQRRWTSSGALICKETIVVENQRFESLPRHLEGAGAILGAIYAATFDTTIGRFEWTMLPVLPTDPRVEAFDRQRRGSALLFQRVAFDRSDRPIEYCEQVVGVDRERFRVVQ
jgi:GntR family transcriptional regulator